MSAGEGPRTEPTAPLTDEARFVVRRLRRAANVPDITMRREVWEAAAKLYTDAANTIESLRAALAALAQDRDRQLREAWEDGFDAGGDPAWLAKHYGYGPDRSDDWPAWRVKGWLDFCSTHAAAPEGGAKE